MKTLWPLLLIYIDLVVGFKLEKFENDLLRYIDVKALQSIFKVHLFRNPHPNCAILYETCISDNNCCHELECKMAVDRAGPKSVCLSKVSDPLEVQFSAQEESDDIGWMFAQHDKEVDELSGEITRDAIQASLKDMKNKEKQILDNNLNLIQELRKPLTFEEIREMRQLKELDDLQRLQELRKMKEWIQNHENNDKRKKERQLLLEKTAKERVEQVLKEEEVQRLQMFKEMMQKNKENPTQGLVAQ